jgi:hypothetical protein
MTTRGFNTTVGSGLDPRTALDVETSGRKPTDETAPAEKSPPADTPVRRQRRLTRNAGYFPDTCVPGAGMRHHNPNGFRIVQPGPTC